ncbi:MAG: SRPBCC family protein [Ilumatobacteraceae bacterium]
MLITNDFEVDQPVDDVWRFFGDIPAVAKCLPGAELTDQQGDDKFVGNVLIRLGPVKLEFTGTANIVERNESTKQIVVDAAGADKKGRGQAGLMLTAALLATPRGTKVVVTQDLQLSGAAAQYGRGLVSDVTSVLMADFATNMQNRIIAIKQGRSADSVATVKPASGLVIGLRAVRMALARVFRRFFLPYRPQSA